MAWVVPRLALGMTPMHTPGMQCETLIKALLQRQSGLVRGTHGSHARSPPGRFSFRMAPQETLHTFLNLSHLVLACTFCTGLHFAHAWDAVILAWPWWVCSPNSLVNRCGPAPGGAEGPGLGMVLQLNGCSVGGAATAGRA